MCKKWVSKTKLLNLECVLIGNEITIEVKYLLRSSVALCLFCATYANLAFSNELDAANVSREADESTHQPAAQTNDSNTVVPH